MSRLRAAVDVVSGLAIALGRVEESRALTGSLRATGVGTYCLGVKEYSTGRLSGRGALAEYTSGKWVNSMACGVQVRLDDPFGP